MKVAAIAFAWLTTLAITALSVATVCYSVFGGVPQTPQREARDESPKLVRDRSMGSQFNRMLMETLQSDRPRPARLEISQHYNELVGCVVKVAGVEADRQSSTSREVAVELLGEIKSLHAIPVLAKHVDWQHDTWASEPNPYIGYMCAKSLRRYGFAAVPEILASLENKPTSDKAVELFAWLLHDAYATMGGDAEAIRAIVLRIDECAERGARVDDLQRVLRELEKIRHKREGERGRARDAA